jgi:hypothetical protein
VGYANALSAPWTFKFLLGPLVDRWGAGSALGRRKAWIVPTTLALVATCVAAGLVCRAW